MNTLRKALISAGLVGTTLVGGANGVTEVLLTGDTADKVKAALR